MFNFQMQKLAKTNFNYRKSNEQKKNMAREQKNQTQNKPKAKTENNGRSTQGARRNKQPRRWIRLVHLALSPGVSYEYLRYYLAS